MQQDKPSGWKDKLPEWEVGADDEEQPRLPQLEKAFMPQQKPTTAKK